MASIVKDQRLSRRGQVRIVPTPTETGPRNRALGTGNFRLAQQSLAQYSDDKGMNKLLDVAITQTLLTS